MQLAGKTPSPAALVFTVQSPITWLLTGLLLTSVVLSGCSTTTPAPITDIHSSTTSAPNSGASSQGNYTVQAGDTLFKIAQQHGTTVQAIAAANNITDPTQLRVGQTLSVSGATAVAASTSTPATTVAVPQEKETVPQTPTAPETAPVESTSPVASSSPRASDASLISWGWPASGALIQGFTESTKGIDIKGAIGDPVIAAASGKVMYAGNGVRGLGNLILLGHSDGFITAYAHNASLLVKTGQEIQKGQKIATLGDSDTTSPRLHFEVRRRGTPVNPLSYLPAR